jgi:cation diffusion facilitator family transporter
MGREEATENTERFAGLTVLILVALGVVQVVLGETISRSVALTANGIDCIGDGFVSAVVWMGLRFFRRPADDRFHYGYYKVENAASIGAAAVMLALATYIILRSYNQLMDPHPIGVPLMGAAVAMIAALIAWGLGIQKYLKGRGSNMSSVKLEAYNTIKDGTASFLAVIALVLSSYGYTAADALVGFVIAGVIIMIGFTAIKESGYMLVDACDGICVERGLAIRLLAEQLDGVEAARVVRLRRTGPVFQGEVEVAVASTMTIEEFQEVSSRITSISREKFPEVERLTVTPHPHHEGEPDFPEPPPPEH